MKLTTKALKKIIQEELTNIITEMEPPMPPQPESAPGEDGMYNPITGEFVPGMTEDEVRTLIDEYEQAMALGGY